MEEMRYSRKRKLGWSVVSVLFIGIMSFSCAPRKNIQKDNYSVEFNKIQGKYGTYLVLTPRDGSGHTAPVFTYVNGLLFDNYSNGRLQDSLVLEVKPDMNINAQVYSLGYKPLEINNLKLQRGDSVNINVKMMWSNEPLHESNLGH